MRGSLLDSAGPGLIRHWNVAAPVFSGDLAGFLALHPPETITEQIEWVRRTSQSIANGFAVIDPRFATADYGIDPVLVRPELPQAVPLNQ